MLTAKEGLIVLSVLVQLALAVKFAVAATRWFYKRTRNNEINRRFVHDMATNHLPHVYSALQQIAAAGGVELKDPPPIQFIELNGHSKKRDEDEDDEG